MMKRLRHCLLGLGILGVGVIGCGPTEPPAQRVILVGIDGADWKVIDPLIREGRLPNLARMKAEGASGPLVSHEPIFSPVVWATISTGKLPDKHGIHTFTAPLISSEGDTSRVPVTANMLRTSRVWEILSRRNRSVGVIGWWTTWPASDVKGFICSERSWPIVMGEQGWPVTTDRTVAVTRRTFPEQLYERIEPLIVTRDELTEADLARVNVSGDLAVVGTRGPSAADMYAKDLSFLRMAESLYPSVEPDFFTVYFELPDVMSHYFWDFWRYYRFARHGEPTEFRNPPHGTSPSTAEFIGRNYERAYEFVDDALGRLMALATDETVVLVVSDHGYGENTEGRVLRVGDDQFASNAHWHVLDGVLLAWGHGVRKGATVEGARVTDITPTILYALGEPIGSDMDGTVVTGLFDSGFTRRKPGTVSTHETGAARGDATPVPSPDDAEMLEVLKSLGYIR